MKGGQKGTTGEPSYIRVQGLGLKKTLQENIKSPLQNLGKHPMPAPEQ